MKNQRKAPTNMKQLRRIHRERYTTTITEPVEVEVVDQEAYKAAVANGYKGKPITKLVMKEQKVDLVRKKGYIPLRQWVRSLGEAGVKELLNGVVPPKAQQILISA